ncbi:hypothetical protein [Streptomyces sp. NPDC005004]
MSGRIPAWIVLALSTPLLIGVGSVVAVTGWGLASFRVPRADLRSWLKATYPDAPEPSAHCRPPYDLCLGLGFSEGDGVEADAGEVDAWFTKTGQAEVVFSAFAG